MESSKLIKMSGMEAAKAIATHVFGGSTSIREITVGFFDKDGKEVDVAAVEIRCHGDKETKKS